jgi:CHAT domain-containing protein
MLPFDTETANRLYEAFFAPLADFVAGRHLLVVLSGPLTSLPLQVLVTQPYATRVPATAAAYRDVSWMVQSSAITVLPSVSSLVSMRRSSAVPQAPRLYLGLGNPVLTGDCGSPAPIAECRDLVASIVKRGEPPAESEAIDPSIGYTRGGLANVDAIRKLCPLPETAQEVTCVAERLDADTSRDLLLGPELTETAVRRLPLDGYRIIHFATHGLLADQTQRVAGGLAEPALVMTPPAVASDADDGLLTASEIAGLHLNADWVVLSACNTGGGAQVGAEALSGLARAFFYAGARTLLVSHWEVASGPAVLLTTGAVELMAGDPSLQPGQAMQRAMLGLLSSPTPGFAHPSVWAPFVVVGVGELPIR